MAPRHLAALAMFAALVVCSAGAAARGSGAAGAPGLARAGGPPLWRAGPRPQGFFRPAFAPRQGAWRHRWAYPYSAWPFGGIWWGSGYGDAPAPLVDPTAVAAAIASEVRQQVALMRPSCRLVTHTREVPAEAGGTRAVTVTRCVAPESFAPWRNEADAADDAPAITGAVPADTPGSDARACRIEMRSVPSESGGVRAIRIRRC
ncbi:MAG: hypothetical protein IT538_10125 [Variibacter sp.]|nr:hypothetical protein [Variibacter sp.]